MRVVCVRPRPKISFGPPILGAPPRHAARAWNEHGVLTERNLLRIGSSKSVQGIVPFPTHAQHTTTSRGAATVDAGGSEPSHSMSRASVLHEEIPRREAAVGGLAPVC
eukprot:3211288-Prymnesium_polylepis.1